MTWIEPVQTSPYAEVAALGPELLRRVEAAKVAEDARKASEEKLAQLRTLGDGAAFTAKLNAARESTPGELGEMPHKLVGEGLPNGFADELFLRVDARPAKKEKAEEDIEAEIARKEQEFADLKQDLAEMGAEEAAEAVERAKDAEEEAAIAVAQKAADEAVAKVKGLAADSRKRKQARQRRQRRQKK